jgi:conjugative relaxase-like TrwC/TraI family protein
MLTVAKVTQGAAGGYADYLEGKTQPTGLGDYYLNDGERVEAPGRWAAGAGTVGCDPEAPVTGEQLRTLMAVRRPDTGQPLRRAGASGEAVAALDATFSAPKSVSAVWAVADPELREEIERAHERAIDQALTYSLQHVKMIRQRIDGRTVAHAKPTGLVATSWRHTTARAVDEQPPDPQLHSHVLLHAAVRRDGRVVAIDSRSWLVHRREIGAAYRSELARELNRLGFEIQRGTGRAGRYFEIAGVPAGLIDRWSSRHHQVQTAIRQRLTHQETFLRQLLAAGGPHAEEATQRLELLLQHGQLAPAQERFMSTATCSAKAPVTMRDLDRQWRETAADHQFTRASLNRPRLCGPELLPALPASLLNGLTEFDATFPARDARAVALERSAGADLTEILATLRELQASQEILKLADGTGTTREHRAREHATTRTAERLATGTVPAIDPLIVTAQTERLDRELAEQGGRLSDEQRQAIELACGSRPLVVIEGHAGTGKSTTLTGIARAHQTAGQRVIVTSTAALAAERLATELANAGVPTVTYSTIALTKAVTTGQLSLGPGTTIIHDEAALASTREQQQLLTLTYQSGARLIEVGDARQNQPVGAGGLWPHLYTTARRNGVHIELTHNQRAHDPADRREQGRYRQGEHELAIRSYAARERIHFAPDQARAEDAALDAAHTDRQAGKSTIVIAQTSNEHLDELNGRAQAIRHQHHELDADSVPAPGRPYRFHPGDDVQVRRTIPHPDLGHLRNGTTATITDVDPDRHHLTLKLGSEHHIRLDRQQIQRADIRLAYVQHPFPAQGQTTDTAHLIASEHATQQGTYVAITRARQQTHIHAPNPTSNQPATDKLQALAEHLSRTEPDLPSITTPLAHEHTITHHPDGPATATPRIATYPVASEPYQPRSEPPNYPAGLPAQLAEPAVSGSSEPPERASAAGQPVDTGLGADLGAGPPSKQRSREWPRHEPIDLNREGRDAQLSDDRGQGWSCD